VDAKRLPPRPNLQQYKKQAKDLVRDHQSGAPDALQRVRRHHPRFRALSDTDARGAELLLADAQLILAREHGYSSWAAFKRRIDALVGDVRARGGRGVPRTTWTDAEVDHLLARQLVGASSDTGIVVGLVDRTGRRLMARGIRPGGAPAFDGDTIFGVALGTMPFTALLLTDSVQSGDVTWTDPVAMYLPTDMRMPQRHGRDITLLDLAAHRSGLQTLPSDFKWESAINPFADFTLEALHQFLSTYQLTRDIDTKTEISITGYGLLGLALARRAGETFASLLHRRILAPLHMHDTALAASGPLASAIGLRSTANDLSTFLSVMVGLTPSDLSAAAEQMVRVGRASGTDGPIGWMSFSVDGIFSRHGHDIFWVDGGTGGHYTFLGFDPTTEAGVVVVANRGLLQRGLGAINVVQNLGLHLLDPRWPAPEPPT
jgi:CubicO group peptidase (beta-lactamase class C family)